MNNRGLTALKPENPAYQTHCGSVVPEGCAFPEAEYKQALTRTGFDFPGLREAALS
jgi:hypothetical protein